jgi:hypothetical protein
MKVMHLIAVARMGIKYSSDRFYRLIGKTIHLLTVGRADVWNEGV